MSTADNDIPIKKQASIGRSGLFDISVNMWKKKENRKLGQFCSTGIIIIEAS